MTATTKQTATTRVYRIYIKATADRVWEAITQPDWTEKYLYSTLVEYDLRPGGTYRALASETMKKRGAEMGYEIPDLCVDGEVIEADPPRKLVQTWRMLMDPDMAAEGFTRLTWELETIEPDVTKLTVIHELEGAPKVLAMVEGERESEGAGGGWNEVLSALKTVLETDEALRV
jgi:uncharacterized protein YndB with AHSA1/START domain